MLNNKPQVFIELDLKKINPMEIKENGEGILPYVQSLDRHFRKDYILPDDMQYTIQLIQMPKEPQWRRVMESVDASS